ncbi:NADP-dependent oxidoreductase domain-containing protein [Cercophora scortea]|uniref:NADP-dependent oxidoreductase domain-containing protein n=1 Tax=Cercophora scortea TaxID=314031 RepID=A0AAE0IN19_9PEZI|nr:NADP-dependent oxidoreductase domain-containing protein [Cercophora scortea]
MATPSRPRQRKIGSRSCDACRIRKVKCTVGIDCTFNKTQSARGPRTLRARTLQQIQEAQQGRPTPTGNQQPDATTSETAKTAPRTAQGEPVKAPEITVESLVLRLCIYRLRLFPVWPIVSVEEVIAALQRDAHDIETFALAAAVGAATMAQLKLDRFADTGVNDSATAASLEAECQRIRSNLDGGIANLSRLRTSFFLHIYHENREAGGTKSLLYLREAITLAQIMGLHRASSYLTLETAEDRLRRRILWLLFVTERGVAMLHKLPVILTSAENLPPLDISGSEDEAHILPAFKKLVNLFWIFDQSRALDILQDAADGLGGGSLGTGSASLNYEMLHALQKRLQDASVEMENGSSDIQKADIYVTRQWMQVLLWRATMSDWRVSISPPSSMVERPIQIAQQFLDFISQLPNAALEAHGPAIEFKVYEIASAVADSLATQLSLPSTPLVNLRPSDILLKLQRILATSRGGNSSLLGLLAARMSRVRTPQSYSITDFASKHAIALSNDLCESSNKRNSGLGSCSMRHAACAVLLSTAPLFASRPGEMAWEEPRKTGMVYRRLGNSGLHVSALGLGGWLTFGGQVENDTTLACMKQAYDCGINFFDTAESYAGGQSEIAMGQVIKKLGWKRNDIVISTKLNWGGANGEVLVNNHGLSRKHIIEGLRASLNRLDLEYVDIIYAHRPDRLTPMEEVVRAFNHVIEIKGWAMYWGTSEWSADEIVEACGIAKQLGLIGPVVEQPFYNLLSRKKVEGEFQRLYSRFGLGLTTFSPLKFGLLSGKYNDSPDAPPAGSRFAKGDDKFVNYMRDNYGNKAWQDDIEKVRKLKIVADKVGILQSELALAWCLKNPNVSSVITGASKPEQVVENVKALKSIDKLTPEIMAEIDEIVGSIELDAARQD